METNWQDMACALESNIPLCCIRFWLSKEWNDKSDEEKLNYINDSNRYDDAEYVRCQECIGGKRVKELKICSDNDFRICWIKLCSSSRKYGT